VEMLINGATYDVTSPDELRASLTEAASAEFAEIWLNAGDGWPAICALVHSDAAWLMFLRYEGDAGFSTRNPNYAGPQEATIEYRLSNGQMDEYPASWDVSTTEAIRALEYFFSNQAMAPWLGWYAEGK